MLGRMDSVGMEREVGASTHPPAARGTSLKGGGRGADGGWVRRLSGSAGGLLSALVLFSTITALPATAQTARAEQPALAEETTHLGELYRDRLARGALREAIARAGLGIRPAPLAWVESPGDSILFHLLALQGKPLPSRPARIAAPPPFEVATWSVVPPEQRQEAEPRFRNVVWTYLGANTLSALDTTRTPRLRAGLQARFGAPTFTVVEQVSEWGAAADSVSGADLVQFEYWFLLNGTIPLLVTDVEGPFDRGLILATDYRYADLLDDLRETFLEPTLLGEETAAYADYYFEPSAERWYKASFNGWRYSVVPVAPPNLDEGRPYARAGR